MKVAVIGLGHAGFTLHLPALAGIEGVDIVGGCDPDAARQSRAAAAFRIPVFASFDALLAAARPDIVVIGTPPDSHAAYCLRAFGAGADVICEKPFVASLQEADDVLAAQKAADRRLALNHEFRLMPIFSAVRDEISRAGADEPVFAQVWQLMDLAPGEEAGWRGQLVQRTLYEAGTHLVDLLLGLFREVPISVQASISGGGVGEGESDAVVVVTLEFSRGRLATIIQDRLCKGERQYVELRADTRQGSLRASFGGRARVSAGLLRSTKPHVRLDYGASGISWREIGASRTRLARNPKQPEMLATRTLFAQTFAAFRNGLPPPTSGEDARVVLEIIAACYMSAQTGRRLRLDAPEVRSLRAMRMGAVPAATDGAAGTPRDEGDTKVPSADISL